MQSFPSKQSYTTHRPAQNFTPNGQANFTPNGTQAPAHNYSYTPNYSGQSNFTLNGMARTVLHDYYPTTINAPNNQNNQLFEQIKQMNERIRDLE